MSDVSDDLAQKWTEMRCSGGRWPADDGPSAHRTSPPTHPFRLTPLRRPHSSDSPWIREIMVCLPLMRSHGS